MDPTVVRLLIWLLSAPILLILLLLCWRRSKKTASEFDSKLAAAQSAINDGQAKLQRIQEKYQPIISQDAEVDRLQAVARQTSTEIEQLRTSYAEKRTYFDKLEQQVALYDERLAFAELGKYEPHFDFTYSEQFKQQILAVRDRQK